MLKATEMSKHAPFNLLMSRSSESEGFPYAARSGRTAHDMSGSVDFANSFVLRFLLQEGLLHTDDIRLQI